MSYEKLNQKILDMQEEIIRAVQENVKIDSVKAEPEAGAPYGRGCKAALENALKLGESLGFRTGNVGDRVGYVEYGEGEEMVAVLGHLDVVPVGEGWTYPPFGAEIHDGKLYGRGVQDDKGPTIGAIFGLKAIRDLGLSIDRRIRVLFGTDEENGSSCVHYYIESGEELPTLGFTPDADYPLIFCEKGTHGILVGKKVTDPGKIKVKSFQGGIAANVVTPHCKLVVEGDLPVQETEGVHVYKEGNDTVVEAEGFGAHGSTPALGINAAERLFEAVKDVDFGGDFQKMIHFVRNRLHGETNGETLGIHYEDEETGETTVNLGVLQYDGENMFLTLDIRYPKNAVVDDITRNVTAAAETEGLEILRCHITPILYVSKDSDLVKKLSKVYEAESGEHLEPLAIGGGTYAKAFKNMVAFGPEFPGQNSPIHQPNEFVEIDKMIKSCQIVAAAMYELAKKD